MAAVQRGDRLPLPEDGSAHAPPAPELQSINRSTAAESPGFEAQGALQVLCEKEQAPERIQLTWESETGNQEVREASGPRWLARFDTGRYQLVGGSCTHGSLVPLQAAVVSDLHPIADAVLRCEAAIVIDVASESPEGSPRPNLATIQPDRVPQPGDANSEPVRIVSTVVNGKVKREVQHGDQPRWSLQDVIPPAVLPSLPANGRVRVSASGYEDTLLAGIDKPGFYTAIMAPLQTVTVRLVGATHGEHWYRLDVKLPSGREHTFERIRLHEDQSVDFKTDMQAEFTVARMTRIGRGPILLQRTVDFEDVKSGRILSLDLTDAVDSTNVGGVAIRVQLPDHIQDLLGKLTVELRPVDQPVTVAAFAEPSDHVGTWTTSSPGSYEKRFDGIRPGKYRVILQPLALEEEVAVEAQGLAHAELVVPALCRLQVWPVGGSGKPVSNTVGHLAWWYADRNEPDPTAIEGSNRESVRESRALGTRLAHGSAQLAQVIDGGWLIVGNSGRRIALEFVGPAVLGAEKREVDLVPGHLDETLRFSNL